MNETSRFSLLCLTPLCLAFACTDANAYMVGRFVRRNANGGISAGSLHGAAGPNGGAPSWVVAA